MQPRKARRLVPGPSDVPALLNEVEAARLLRCSVRSLQSWRLLGRGPAYAKIGRAVRYRKTRLEAFIAASERTSTRGGRPPAAA